MNEKEVIARIWFKYAGSVLEKNQIKTEVIQEIWKALGYTNNELVETIINIFLHEIEN